MEDDSNDDEFWELVGDVDQDDELQKSVPVDTRPDGEFCKLIKLLITPQLQQLQKPEGLVNAWLTLPDPLLPGGDPSLHQYAGT
jgi:hypothetical protein